MLSSTSRYLILIIPIVKYYNAVTNVFIIKVGRSNVDVLLQTLILSTMFDFRECKFRILHVSGTLQKCEVKLKKLTQIWMHQHKKLPKKMPIQSEIKELMAKEISISRARAFYYCHSHPEEQYELLENSTFIRCSSCMKGKCRYCFGEYHGAKCNEEVRIKKIKKRWERVRKILNLTGEIEEYLRTCNDCKLIVFKDLDQRTISCFLCSKELKHFN